MPDEDGRRDLTTRDKQGLMPIQRKLLNTLADHPDWRDAADVLGVEYARVHRWLREDADFKREYELMFAGATDVARLRLEAASEQASETLVDLMEEWKTVKFKCEHCDKDNEVSIKNPAIRAKAAELVLKTSGVLIDRRKVEHEGEVLNLTFSQGLDMASLRAGYPVSEQSLREFQALGLVDASGNLKSQHLGDTNVIDVEGRRIPDDGLSD